MTTVVDKTDLLYAINSSKVTKKNEEKADLEAFKANVDEQLGNDRISQSIAVKGYASATEPAASASPAAGTEASTNSASGSSSGLRSRPNW